jgi:hypothetical protein
MFTDLTHRLRSLIRRRTVEQALDDELRFPFERLVDWMTRSQRLLLRNKHQQMRGRRR